MNRYIEERTYTPDGADIDDYNALAFRVGVFYRGNGKWCIANSRDAHRQMTSTGKWLLWPLKMTQMRWCLFDFETACALAEEHVNDVEVHGQTWSQWQAERGAA